MSMACLTPSMKRSRLPNGHVRSTSLRALQTLSRSYHMCRREHRLPRLSFQLNLVARLQLRSLVSKLLARPLGPRLPPLARLAMLLRLLPLQVGPLYLRLLSQSLSSAGFTPRPVACVCIHSIKTPANLLACPRRLRSCPRSPIAKASLK